MAIEVKNSRRMVSVGAAAGSSVAGNARKEAALADRMTNAALGVRAEECACRALINEGWSILGRRLRTKSGEIDAVAQKNGLLAFVEVKARATLAMAADAIRPRQQARLLAAAEILLAEHPDWGEHGVRFDILLVDPTLRVRRVQDALRLN